MEARFGRNSRKYRSPDRKHNRNSKSSGTGRDQATVSAPATEIYVGGGTSEETKRWLSKSQQPTISTCMGATSIVLSCVVLLLLILNYAGKINIFGAATTTEQPKVEDEEAIPRAASTVAFSDANKSMAYLLQEMRVQQIRMEQMLKEIAEQKKKVSSLESDKLVQQLKLQNLESDQESQRNRVNFLERSFQRFRNGDLDYPDANPPAWNNARFLPNGVPAAKKIKDSNS